MNQTSVISNQKLSEQKWDVVIIGAGLAGLTAANVLADKNLNVLLLEKNSRLGGKAQTVSKRGGHFNLGPHALYKRGEGIKILRQLDISLKGKSPNLNGKITYKGGEYQLPISPYNLLANNFFAWSEKKEFIRIIKKVLTIKITNIADESLFSWVEKNIISEKVKEIFYALCRLATYTDAPKKLSVISALSQLKISMGGALYVDGGWQSIVNQLEMRAKKGGIYIVSQKIVKEIKGVFPLITLKLSDQSEIETAILIATTSPEDTSKMLKSDSCSKIMNWVNTSIPVKGACLDVHLSKLPNPKVNFALGLDQALYFSNHSKSAKLTVHPNHVVIHVFKYLLGENNVNTQDVIREELEQFLQLFQPNWYKYVIQSRYISNITVSARLQESGREQDSEEHLTNIPGFFVAGEWTTSKAILADAAIISGKVVAEKALNLLERK